MEKRTGNSDVVYGTAEQAGKKSQTLQKYPPGLKPSIFCSRTSVFPQPVEDVPFLKTEFSRGLFRREAISCFANSTFRQPWAILDSDTLKF